MTQEYISQVSKEVGGRVTKQLSKEFSRTESRISGAFSKHDEFLLNLQVRTCSVAVPGTSRKDDSENREPTGDRSLNDPCTKVVFSSHHSGNPNGSELEESHHMVTGVEEGIPHCSPEFSSGKQKNARSTSQPHFRKENTPATTGAHQVLLALQQSVTKRYSVNFTNYINRISKLPKSFTTTMPTIDGKSEKFEVFENFSKEVWKLIISQQNETKRTTSLVYAWWCAPNIQKRHLSQQRKVGRNSDCVP